MALRSRQVFFDTYCFGISGSFSLTSLPERSSIVHEAQKKNSFTSCLFDIFTWVRTFVGSCDERFLTVAFQPTVAVNQIGHVFCHGQRGGVHQQWLKKEKISCVYDRLPLVYILAFRLQDFKIKEQALFLYDVTCLDPSMCTVSRAWPSLSAAQAMLRTWEGVAKQTGYKAREKVSGRLEFLQRQEFIVQSKSCHNTPFFSGRFQYKHALSVCRA